MELKKITESDKKQTLKKIDDSLDEHLRKTFVWIRTDEGQIVVNAIASLSSYVIGDPTGVLMPSIIQSADAFIRKRLLKRVPNLMDELNRESPRINEEFVKSDVGQNLLRETLKNLIDESNEEKANLHKKFLINSYVNTDTSKERISIYMKVLVSLDNIDLQILQVLWKPGKIVREIIESKKIGLDGVFSYAIKNDIIEYMQINTHLFNRSLVKLESESIISTKGSTIVWSSGGFYDRFKNEIINRTCDDVHRLVTPLGLDFMNFINAE